MAQELGVQLVFNAAHVLPRIVPAENLADSILFNESPNPGPFHDLGVGLDEAVVPKLLKPTNVFHQELSNRLLDLGVPRAKKQPFVVELSNGSTATMTLQLRLMPPKILLLTAWLRGIVVNEASFAGDLIALQRIDDQPQVLAAISSAAGMVESLDHRIYRDSRPTRIVPALDLDTDASVNAEAWAESHDRELAGVLIRDADYESAASSLVEAIKEKNSALNVKGLREVALIDKQGLLFISSDPGGERFRRLVHLQALAQAYALFLRSYRSHRSEGAEYYDFILSKVIRWVAKPDPVFRESVSNRHGWVLLSEEFRLPDDVAEILEGGIVSTRLAESRDLFDRLSQRWWEQPNFPEFLSEKLSQERDGSQFPFVEDSDLRRIIASDLREAEVAFQARAYKACMVLSGSVAEAMLLAAILGCPNNQSSEASLLKEGLHELVGHARELGLVTDPKALDLVDDWLRFYRNLVHPGRQRREEIQPDENRAAIALRAVRSLAEELGP